jgi:hypothetical protein
MKTILMHYSAKNLEKQLKIIQKTRMNERRNCEIGIYKKSRNYGN